MNFSILGNYSFFLKDESLKDKDQSKNYLNTILDKLKL